MIKERLKDMELKITELSDYLQISRPTMYKFIEAYDSGDVSIINKHVLKLFKYIDENPLIGKKTVVSYILTNLVEEKELGDTAENRIYNQIKRFLIANPESIKSQFIELIVQKTDYDDAIKYLLKIYPLLRKRKLSDEEIAFLKPFDDIKTILDKEGVE
jgi:predicted transcriptional regulator